MNIVCDDNNKVSRDDTKLFNHYYSERLFFFRVYFLSVKRVVRIEESRGRDEKEEEEEEEEEAKATY